MKDTRDTKIDQVKKLRSDYDRLIQEVRDDLLSQIQRAIAQLQEIGYHYSLEESLAPSASAKRSRGRLSIAGIQLNPAPTINFDPAKKCLICKSAGHDGRSHRRQRGGRCPFTLDELSQLGLRPPVESIEGVA